MHEVCKGCPFEPECQEIEKSKLMIDYCEIVEVTEQEVRILGKEKMVQQVKELRR